MRVVHLDDQCGVVEFDWLHVFSHCITDKFYPCAEHPTHAGCVVRTE